MSKIEAEVCKKPNGNEVKLLKVFNALHEAITHTQLELVRALLNKHKNEFQSIDVLLETSRAVELHLVHEAHKLTINNANYPALIKRLQVQYNITQALQANSYSRGATL